MILRLNVSQMQMAGGTDGGGMTVAGKSWDSGYDDSQAVSRNTTLSVIPFEDQSRLRNSTKETLMVAAQNPAFGRGCSSKKAGPNSFSWAGPESG